MGQDWESVGSTKEWSGHESFTEHLYGPKIWRRAGVTWLWWEGFTGRSPSGQRGDTGRCPTRQRPCWPRPPRSSYRPLPFVGCTNIGGPRPWTDGPRRRHQPWTFGRKQDKKHGSGGTRSCWKRMQYALIGPSASSCPTGTSGETKAGSR